MVVVVSAWTPPEAVIFDFNGTVSDDEPLLAELYPEIFAHVGVEFPVDRYYAELAGYSDPEIIERVLRTAGRFDRALAASLAERLVAAYLRAVAERPPVTAAAADCVRRIAERVPIAVASGARRAQVEAVLAAAGLRDLFGAVVCAEDVSRGKPDPEVFLSAACRLGVVPGTALVFEDSAQGVAAAVAAGMRCVAVEGTFAASPLQAAGALAVVPRLDWSIPVMREFFP